MKTLFYKILPYLISIIFGVIIFIIVKGLEQHDETMSNLLINISSDLLSIPLVFICYEVVSRICNRGLKVAMFKSTAFEINSIVLNLINTFRQLMDEKNTMDNGDLENFLNLKKRDIARKLLIGRQVEPDMVKTVQKNRIVLSDILYKKTTLEALDNDQSKIKNLLNMSKEIDILNGKLNSVASQELSQKDRISLAVNIENVIDDMREWLDNFETDALINHQNAKII